MIVQKNFLSKLREFGLNSYESKLWAALLSRGSSTAGELSDIANVPRSRTYDVLESLEKKGFIIMKVGKPIKYIAITPSEVIERIKRKVQQEAEEKELLINELRESKILEELNLLHKQGMELIDPNELTGLFKGRPSIYEHLESMIKKAKKSIVIMTTSAGLLRKSKSLGRGLKKAKERGVKIRIAAPITKENEKTAKETAKIAELRNTDSLGRFCVVDGKEILFMLLSDKDVHSGYDIGVWANSEFFASMLQGFFESEWAKMKVL